MRRKALRQEIKGRLHRDVCANLTKRNLTNNCFSAAASSSDQALTATVVFPSMGLVTQLGHYTMWHSLAFLQTIPADRTLRAGKRHGGSVESA